MEIKNDFDDLISGFDEEDAHSDLKCCAFSPEDSGESDSVDSTDFFLPGKVDSNVECPYDHDSLDQLYAIESEKDEQDVSWVEAQQAAQEMRRRAEQERGQREREELLRQMRADYQTATNSFSCYEEEEEEERFGFNWRAVKQSWLCDLPESVSTPSNLRIVRTCITEPGVTEVIVDFRRSNEL